MGLRKCDKCDEMVDEAKAFCPACGNAFVEEESRSAPSSFEAADSTVQLGQTMYNQMLSDMGLNISKTAEPVEKRVEVIAPVVIAPAAAAPPPAEKKIEKPRSNRNLMWIVLGAAVVVVAFVIILAAAAALYWFWPRIT